MIHPNAFDEAETSLFTMLWPIDQLAVVWVGSSLFPSQSQGVLCSVKFSYCKIEVTHIGIRLFKFHFLKVILRKGWAKEIKHGMVIDRIFLPSALIRALVSAALPLYGDSEASRIIAWVQLLRINWHCLYCLTTLVNHRWRSSGYKGTATRGWFVSLSFVVFGSYPAVNFHSKYLSLRDDCLNTSSDKRCSSTWHPRNCRNIPLDDEPWTLTAQPAVPTMSGLVIQRRAAVLSAIRFVPKPEASRVPSTSSTEIRELLQRCASTPFRWAHALDSRPSPDWVRFTSISAWQQ